MLRFRSTSPCSVTLLAAALMTVASAQGQTVLQYYMAAYDDVAQQPGSQISTPASTVAPGLSPTDIVRGPGINPTGLVRAMSSNGWNNINANTPEAERVDPTRENAILTGDFYQFGFAVQAGYTASISTLDHALRRSAINGPMFYEWQYSLDGFATAGMTITPLGADWTAIGWDQNHFTYYGRSSGTAPGSFDPFDYMISDLAGQNEGNAMPTFDLSGISDLQEIEGGSSVAFRLYSWAGSGNTGAASTNTIALGRDNVNNPDRFGGPMLTGTVIPEPSTYAVIFGAIALGAVLVLRRRRG